MDKFKGILFTLKKRVENIVENDNDHYKYLVMGYYDGLDINTVDKWYAMRPRGLRELNLQVDISSPFADQYTMRAFCIFHSCSTTCTSILSQSHGR